MARFPAVGEAFGPYWIVGTLGRGGLGVVFEAQDTRLGRSVALKVLSPLLTDDADFRARFDREAADLARLNSLHIVQVFEHGERDGCLFLATQLVPGGDLGALLASQGPLPPKVAVSVLGQLCEALADAHAAGIVHGDLKPTNVLIRDRGTVLYAYLCDFAVAGSDQSVQGRLGQVAGSTAYLAPEIHDGVRADSRSDIYSLGCVLWSALAGVPPYEGTDVQVAMSHLRDPIPQLATTGESSVQLNAILSRALAKNPDDRFATVRDFGAALSALVSLPGPVRIAPPPPLDVEPVETPDLAETPAPLAPTPPPLVEEGALAPVSKPEPDDTSERPAVPGDVEPVETPEPDTEPESLPAPRPLFADELDEEGEKPRKLSRRQRRRAAKQAKETPRDVDFDKLNPADPVETPAPEPGFETGASAPSSTTEAPGPPPLPKAKSRRAEKPRSSRDFGWLVPGALLGVVPVVGVVLAFVLLNGNTPARTSSAIEVETGAAFSVGAFDVKPGWTVNPAPDVSPAGDPVTRIEVANLTVTNSSQDSQTASMTFSFIKDKLVITTVDCRSAVVGAGLDQLASCSTDLSIKAFAGWDRITVDENPE